MKAHAYVCRSDGGFLLSYCWKNKNKLSLTDDSGNLIWTVHLPDSRDKLYLIDEKTMFYIDDNGNIFLWVNLYNILINNNLLPPEILKKIIAELLEIRK